MNSKFELIAKKSKENRGKARKVEIGVPGWGIWNFATLMVIEQRYLVENLVNSRRSFGSGPSPSIGSSDMEN